MAREYAPEAPAETKREFAPEEGGLYQKTREALKGALPEDGKTRIVGPALAAGAGELIKGGGAAIGLAFPETGKKISDVGRGIVEETTSRYPVVGRIGEFGSYVYPYGIAQKGIQALRGGKEAATTLGKAAEAAGAAGVTGYVTTPGEQKDRALAAALGTTLGGTFSLAGSVASRGYNYTKDLLNKAFGGDAKRLADALRDYSTRRTGAEAEAAKKLAAEAEQRAGIAETAAGRQERKAEAAYRELPGTKTVEEAGRFRPIPESEQSIGDRLRQQADRVLNELKAIRSRNADKIKGEAFSEALAKEKAGQKVSDTAAFKDAMASIQKALVNPETKLANVSIDAVRSQLQQVKRALDPREEIEGVIVGRPASFEALETLRRFLRDRSYGLPAEGFDAIGQQQAGRLAEAVERIQVEFSPKIKTFREQYRKDSEPLQVFKTNIGKLFEEQLPGVKGFSKVASEDIPSRVFKNRESFEGLVKAVGGNREFAENEARKYFAGQMERLSGDVKKLEQFIRDNRTMLDLTNARDMAESYFARAAAYGRRGEAGRKIAEESRVEAAAQAKRQESFATLQSEIMTARTPEEISRYYRKFANELLSDKTINQNQYRVMLEEANKLLQTTKDMEQAKAQILRGSMKALGAGAIGAAGYYGIKSL